ncbi:hypothetical protein POM88_000641 [Heracleum sosnowskyi]|uniref:Terpene synthase metal-binding domain-containing protein n=1 Tax=Heracleum sosnowskyi TaxID=360622 RepID=A0AAD8JEB1_9APIA|nr:hypothetical protein POM88_000641 [Heracleum sosnowskyi]
MGHGPTTRSPSNAAAKPGTEDASEKEGTYPCIQLGISANPLIELPQAADASNGSMADFFAMRTRQQQEAEKKKSEKEKAEKKKAKKEKDAATTSKKVVTNTVFTDIEEVSVPERMRRKTRMDKVHTRSLHKRLVIGMNEFFQPITENDKVLSELSNFMGTLAKRYMSVALISGAYKMLSVTSLVLMGNVATRDAFDWISKDPLIVKASSVICRLSDDIVGHEFELERPHIPTAVGCFMKEYGVPKETAYDGLHKHIIT